MNEQSHVPPRTECYCGCCGRPCGAGAVWCADCVPHLSPNAQKPPWDRTHFARFRRECPFAGTQWQPGGEQPR